MFLSNHQDQQQLSQEWFNFESLLLNYSSLLREQCAFRLCILLLKVSWEHLATVSAQLVFCDLLAHLKKPLVEAAWKVAVAPANSLHTGLETSGKVFFTDEKESRGCGTQKHLKMLGKMSVSGLRGG